MIIFLWLLFAFIVAFVFGVARTIGFWGSLLVCIFFSPLLGLIITLCFKTNEEEARQKQMLQAQQDLLKINKPAVNINDELAKLIEYKNKGVINEQEFEKLKKKLVE